MTQDQSNKIVAALGVVAKCQQKVNSPGLNAFGRASITVIALTNIGTVNTILSQVIDANNGHITEEIADFKVEANQFKSHFRDVIALGN